MHDRAQGAHVPNMRAENAHSEEGVAQACSGLAQRCSCTGSQVGIVVVLMVDFFLLLKALFSFSFLFYFIFYFTLFLFVYL